MHQRGRELAGVGRASPEIGWTAVTEAQLDAGYKSASGFRAAITKMVGETPARTQGRQVLSAQWLDTPIGAMLAIASETGVHLLEFGDRKTLPGEIARLRQRIGPICFGPSEVLEVLAMQLDEYFSGKRSSFAVSVAQCGTAIETAIWAAMRQIPIGQTRSYPELADVANRPGATRAVARSKGGNQVAIVVPCHRVIGADASLEERGGTIGARGGCLSTSVALRPPARSGEVAMSIQVNHAETFRALHVPGRPLVLFNIWDAGSAKAVAASGARAIATGSWSVAAANGFEDGERMPLDLVIANLQRIVGAVDLPVTIDLESGYGADPTAVGESVAQAILVGAIGCNLEDSLPADGSLRPTPDQAARIRAARAGCRRRRGPGLLERPNGRLLSGPARAARRRHGGGRARARQRL